MFVLIPDRQALGVHPDQVVAIIESINAPNIAVPNRGTSPTKAYIVGVRLPSGAFTCFIYMHILDAGQAAIFAPDPFEVPIEHYSSLEAAAIQFGESMGFMLDNLNFRARTVEEQATLVNTLPVFFDTPPAAAGASSSTKAAPVAPTNTAALAPLAKLLGSF